MTTPAKGGPKPLVLLASAGAPDSIFCADCGRLRMPSDSGASCPFGHGKIGPHINLCRLETLKDGTKKYKDTSRRATLEAVVSAFKADRLFWFDGVDTARIKPDHMRGLGL